MNAKWKQKWVAALRSGHYLQGRGFLCKSNGRVRWCPLGVLCDIAGDGWWIQSEVSGAWLYTEDENAEMYGSFCFMAPGSIASEVELDHNTMLHIARMNDNSSERWSFRKIADWIEANL